MINVDRRGVMELDHRRALIGALSIFIIIAGLLSPVSVMAQDKNIGTSATAKRLPRMVDLGADKCVPCIMMAPILEEMKKEYTGVLDVEFIDVWKNPSAGQKYGIRGIPTQIFYDASGKELGRHLGFISKEQILQSFNKFGIIIKTSPGEKKR
jgi:thioredoxin 1